MPRKRYEEKNNISYLRPGDDSQAAFGNDYPQKKSSGSKVSSPYIDLALNWLDQANLAYKNTKVSSLRKYKDYVPEWWTSKLEKGMSSDKRFADMSGDKKRDIIKLMIRHFWKNWLADWQDAEREFFTYLWDDLVEESLMSYRIRHTPLKEHVGLTPDERRAKRKTVRPARKVIPTYPYDEKDLNG
jgi:hypothetical protein